MIFSMKYCSPNYMDTFFFEAPKRDPSCGTRRFGPFWSRSTAGGLSRGRPTGRSFVRLHVIEQPGAMLFAHLEWK